MALIGRDCGNEDEYVVHLLSPDKPLSHRYPPSLVVLAQSRRNMLRWCFTSSPRLRASIIISSLVDAAAVDSVRDRDIVVSSVGLAVSVLKVKTL